MPLFAKCGGIFILQSAIVKMVNVDYNIYAYLLVVFLKNRRKSNTWQENGCIYSLKAMPICVNSSVERVLT